MLCISQPDRFEQHLGVGAEGYKRRWIECVVCGAATNELPQISVEKLSALRSAYYEVDFANSNIGEKYSRVMALPDAQSDNAGRVARIVDFSRSWFSSETTPRVLDIGAGTGVFLSRLIDKTGGAWQCVGVEPDPNAAEHLRKLGKFDVIEAMYQGQPELKDFGLVTLNKVLEHISEPVSFLRKVAGSMRRDKSLIYIEVPDKLTASARPPTDNILGALHCHLYDPLSLCHLADAAGMTILHTDRIVEPSGKLTVYAFGTLPELAEKGKRHE
jgi:2-polyprenyl-3-methyl-5-hydroxy-6-metoxy-1,4-benzoquinol methylase